MGPDGRVGRGFGNIEWETNINENLLCEGKHLIFSKRKQKKLNPKICNLTFKEQIPGSDTCIIKATKLAPYEDRSLPTVLISLARIF